MRDIVKILISVFAAIVLVLMILGGLYVYSLSKVEIGNVSVNDLQEITLTGFTLDGNIQLYNGGILPVGVKNITYRVILESSGSELASGNIDGKTISPKKTADFPFLTEINWVPTAELALNLITPDQTYAKVEGMIYVADLKFVDFKIPFEVRVDLEKYIKQFVQANVEETVEKYKEQIGEIAESAIGILGQILG